MKSIAIMQPYFLPYIDYFRLINTVDEFVIYDNIQYTKKGWINRNRILVNGMDKKITLPINKDSDYLNINERFLANSWNNDKKKIFNLINNSYRKAPQYNNVYPIISSIIDSKNSNLFEFILNSIQLINSYLSINTKITISSQINIDHKLKGSDKIIAICKVLNANSYINAIGGQILYNVDKFNNESLDLKFIKPHNFEYKQFKNEFIPNLSILDVLMFNKIEKISDFLNFRELI